jgi:hypothetical protein
MVETGHGIGDNFTSQVMKKPFHTTYTHLVQRRLVGDCYLFIYLFIVYLMTLSLGQATWPNVGIISEE